MTSVFIDKIGKIYNGNYNDCIEKFEQYRDLSQQGIGRFSQKNVYLLEDNKIVKSYGDTAFATGGVVSSGDSIIKDFIIGKKLDNNKISDSGFMTLQSNSGTNDSVLVYKNNDGQFPLITISKGSATFHKSNFSIDSYINSMADTFRDVCIKNGIKFSIK